MNASLFDMTQRFRINSKPTAKPNVRTVAPPRYMCQFPGCGETSDTIACPFHLAMLPISIQGTLTNALGTGEAGMYGPAMAEAVKIWNKSLDTSEAT